MSEIVRIGLVYGSAREGRFCDVVAQWAGQMAAKARFEVEAIDPKKVDFTIEGDAGAWREMIENIRRNGEADTSHDINTLAHFGERLKIVYEDPDGHDKLYRFMESIQKFFDLSSKVEVRFN